MLEFGDRLLYSPAWEAFSTFAIMAGILSIIMLMFRLDGSRKARLMIAAGLTLLSIVLVFSMLFEELLPTWPLLPAARRLPYGLSFLGFFVFLIMFLWSGRLLMNGLLPNLIDVLRRGRNPEVKAARSEALRELRPGLLMWAGSVIVFAVSLIGYHGAEETLGWAFN